MFKMLRSRKGQFELVGIILGGMFVALSVASLTVPQIKDWHRSGNAVDLCYCMATGLSEYECKADATVIETQEGKILDECKAQVEGMDRDELLNYVLDDVDPPDAGDNLGHIN